IGGSNFRVGFVEPADPHPDRFDSFDQQIIAPGSRRRPAEKTEDQDATAPGEAAQRLLEGRTVDRVIDDVDPAAIRQVYYFVAEAVLVINRMVGALVEADGAFLFGARGGDHTGVV